MKPVRRIPRHSAPQPSTALVDVQVARAAALSRPAPDVTTHSSHTTDRFDEVRDGLCALRRA